MSFSSLLPRMLALEEIEESLRRRRKDGTRRGCMRLVT